MTMTEIVDTSVGRVPSLTAIVTGTVKRRKRTVTWSVKLRVSYSKPHDRFCWSIARQESAGSGLGEKVLASPCRLRKSMDNPHGRSYKGTTTRVGETIEGPARVSCDSSFVRSECIRLTGTEAAWRELVDWTGE